MRRKGFSVKSNLPDALKRRRLPLLIIAVATAAYSSLSILRHRHFSSGAFDLGIFDQIVWLYSRFEPPFITMRANLLNEHALGDHFHPILISLAPLYWLTDSIEALLIAQAFLFALAVLPIFLFAEKRLGTFPYPGYREVKEYLDGQQARGYRKIFEEDGWTVLQRP